MVIEDNKKGFSKIIILAMVLLFPGFLSIMMNKFGSNSYVTLPIFGEKTLTGESLTKMGKETPDTAYHIVKELGLLSWDGRNVTMLDNDSSITVVNLFYSADQSFSKSVMDVLSPIVERFAYNPLVDFFSVSVDSGETENKLTAFLKGYKGLDNRNWHVVYQPTADISDYVRNELLIDAMVDPQDSTRYIISNLLVLIDSKHRIRGFYDSAQASEIKRLEDEIKLLLVEEVRNRPLRIEQQ